MIEPLTYTVIASGIFSILVCLVLLYGNIFETHNKTMCGTIFSWMLFTNIIALLFEILSWILEAGKANTVILYICNTISIVAALVLIAQFALYIIMYLGERIVLPRKIMRIVLIFCSATIGVTIVACAAGWMFTIKDGVYIQGGFYAVYSVFAIIAMLVCVVEVIRYKKELGLHDSIAMYSYILLPTVSAVINLINEDLSFTYQSITLSALILYVMIQSEQRNKLLEEKVFSDYYASHDEMTGLLSRRAYIERLEQLQESDKNVGVIFCDINGLKYTNDNLGHSKGDQLIKDFALILTDNFRNEDLYRISGDEFIVLAEEVKENAFFERAGKLEEEVCSYGYEIACIGAVHGKAKHAEELVQKAESLMYMHKERFHNDHPEMQRSHVAEI